MQVRRYVDFRCLYYIASVMLFLLPAAGSAQTAAQSKLSLAAIRELPGEEIGRGVNQIPSTDLKLHTYRVERLKLPSQVKAKIDGIRVTVKKAWRITISGEHFRVGAMPAILLIDGQPVAIGQENPDQTELSFIVLNPQFVRNGASLALTYEGDLLVDSRDPELVSGEFSLPDLEGAKKYSLPEPMLIKKR
jgi:hypothetical protein